MTSLFMKVCQLAADSFSLKGLTSRADVPVWGAVLVALMVINWYLEAVKWKILCGEGVTMREAFRGIWIGLATGVLTPGRWGEAVGRLGSLPSVKRLRGAAAWCVGGSLQWGVTMVMGIVAVGSYLQGGQGWPLAWNWKGWPGPSLAWGLAIGVAAIPVSWRIYPRILRFLNGTKAAVVKTACQFRSLSVMVPLAGALSFLRYFVFGTQFILILYLLGFSQPLIKAMEMTGLIFFITTLLPLWPVSEPVARGSLALLFYPHWESQAGPLILAPPLLWLLNVGIPALGGLVALHLKGKQSA
ncbi:MAG: flippase-like domain-containing protein [Flavobacteriales bacterium]|nr:flippase-like domain-containing protein [Flavobacteriales bacterium]